MITTAAVLLDCGCYILQPRCQKHVPLCLLTLMLLCKLFQQCACLSQHCHCCKSSNSRASQASCLQQGPAAVGKTSLITAIASQKQQRLERVNNSDTTTIQDYFGSWLPISKKQCSFQKGVLYRCLEDGGWLLADELNLAPPAVIAMLAPVLEGSPVIAVPGTDKQLAAHPNFR